MSTSTKMTAKIKEFRLDGEKGIALYVNGLEVHFPLRWFPRLAQANRNQLENWQLIGSGSGIHWPDLDEDISAEGVLMGRKSFEYKPFIHPLAPEKLKDIRSNLLHMTQKELAKILGYSEVSIRHMEKGRSPITTRFEEAVLSLL
jgi:DNA-binding XRE family transcriptional regulator